MTRLEFQNLAAGKAGKVSEPSERRWQALNIMGPAGRSLADPSVYNEINECFFPAVNGPKKM